MAGNGVRSSPKIACFGIGNMSQVNAITGSITNAITAFFTINDSGITVIHWVIGLSLAALVALILLGGIKRIGKVAEKLVPIMSVFYVLVCLGVIFSHAGNIGGAFAKIFTAAFSPRAVLGAASGIALRKLLSGVSGAARSRTKPVSARQLSLTPQRKLPRPCIRGSTASSRSLLTPSSFAA